MPHTVVLYTPDLESATDMTALCRALADAMLGVRDEADKQVFPTGGVRVLAYPAAHHAVADGYASGTDSHGFVYINLRMGRGRSESVQQRAGEALAEAARAHFAPLKERRRFGLTVQIDEGPEVFDAKLGNLHDIFKKG